MIHIKQVCSRGARTLSACLVLSIVAGGVLPVAAEGLPGEYLINSRWRAMYMERSALSNPAALVHENFITLRVVAAKPLAEFNLCEGSLAWPLGMHQTVGVSWSGLFTTRFAETGLRLPDGTVSDPFAETGLRVGESQNAVVLTYAADLWRRLALGVNLTTAWQQLYSQDAGAGVGLDIGASWRALRHAVLGEHILGISVRNLLAPQVEDNEHLSRTLFVQWSGSYVERRITTVAEFSVRDLGAADNLFQGQKIPEWSALFRLEGWVLRVLKLYGVAEIANGRLGAGGIGAGLNVPSVNAGRDLELLYQFLAVRDGLSATHSTSLRFELGRHREEQWARRLAARLNIAPNDLYTRALTLYAQRRYWDALLVFSELQRTYPDFFKNDWVSYFRASCLEELGFDDAADTVYRRAASDYPRTFAGPYVNLGLMRIAYRRGDQQTVEQQLRELNKPVVPDSVKFHAYYLMAQVQIRAGQSRMAKALLEVIPPKHPEYPFARHSLAIIQIAEGAFEEAADNLQLVVQTPVETSSQAEIVNRSYVFLGYLFYERAGDVEGALAKAVSALRRVPPTSVYREDALLGLGWCALRARQWNDCLEAGRALERESPRAVNRCEGRLLQAYAYLMQENLVAALEVLEQAAAVVDTLRFVSPSDQQMQSEVRTTATAHNELGRRVLELTSAGAPATAGNELASARQRQEQSLDRLKTLRRALAEAERTAFFSRGLEALREDVQYALARVRHMLAQRGVHKVQEQLKERTQSIDAEIERLQHQLQQMGR